MAVAQKTKHPVVGASLLCRTGPTCGYYGNPQWDGYCSKCWRDSSSQLKVHNVTDEVKYPAQSTPVEFGKFQEKKRLQADKKSSTLRSILRKSTSSADQGQPFRIITSPQSPTAWTEFDGLLGRFSRLHQTEVKRQVRGLLEKTSTMTTVQLSDAVQDLYHLVEERLHQNGCDNVQEALFEFENILINKLYQHLFAPPEDEAKDVELQSRIKQLHWVATGGFLEHGLNNKKSDVNAQVHESMTKLIELASQHGIEEKLNHIVVCSKALMEALRLSADRPPSADDFLPALIFIVLTANPPLLLSNVNFVSRFAAPSRLLAGEQAYYYTNLVLQDLKCCAVNFIQHLSADSFQLSTEDFEDYMSGVRLPPCTDEDAMLLRNPVMEGLQKALDTFKALQTRHRTFLTNCDEFEQRMKHDKEELLSKINQIREQFPPLSVSLDASLSPEKEARLPAPLQPNS